MRVPKITTQTIIEARTPRAFFIPKENEMASLTQLKTLPATESIISGITNADDLKTAIEMGATYAGLIFVLTSPYGIAIDAALEFADASPIPLIGIFQNSDLEDILYVSEQIPLFAVLLNGWETQGFINQLRERLPMHIKIIKIAHMCDGNPKMNYQNVDFYLLGGHVGEQLAPNWALLEHLNMENVFLSGNWADDTTPPKVAKKLLGFEMNVKMMV